MLLAADEIESGFIQLAHHNIIVHLLSPQQNILAQTHQKLALIDSSNFNELILTSECTS